MEERKIKFNFDEIQSVEGPKIDDPVPSFYNNSTEKPFAAPAEESAAIPFAEETPAEETIPEAEASEAQPDAAFKPQYEAIEEAVEENVAEEVEDEPKAVQTQQNICIIDETATTVIIEQGPDILAEELNPAKAMPAAAPASVKAEPKEKIKFNIPQIILMAILGIIALWFIMFTVDHSFAVNATYPVFSKLEAEYADGSKSFKGLGYTVQFTYDKNGNLSQSCNPFWKSGPNDGRTDIV